MTNTPFLMQPSNNWDVIWNSMNGKGTPIMFQNYNYDYPAGGPYLPLGDTAIVFGPLQTLLFAPGPAAPKSLAHPVDFTWILDDAGSGNPSNINYWWPVAPPNYVAMGLCFSNQEKPPVSNYWCVHERHCVAAGMAEFWSDQGSGWSHHNGDLSIPTMPTTVPPNGLLPNTLLSTEAMGKGMGAPYVLSWT